MKRKIEKSKMLLQFAKVLKAGEKSQATIEKYMRDTGQFLDEMGEGTA